MGLTDRLLRRLRGGNGRRRLIGSAVVLAVLGSGYYGFQLQYPAAKAGRACSGMLSVDPVLNLVGKSRLSVSGLGFHTSSWRFDVSSDVTEPSGLATRCKVGGAEIAIETTAGAHNAYGVYTFQREQESFPVPLNGSWQGLMVTRNDESTASVILSCKNWSPEKGSGILVTAESPYETEATEAVRLNLARVVTGTAVRAAQKTGCETDAGNARGLTAPATHARAVPAEGATGTCAGMTSTAQVRETDAGRAPVEECLLLGGLQLTAAYGPFSDASDTVVGGEYGGHDTRSGVDSTTAWTSAKCPGALGVGYYHASPVEGSDRRFTSGPLTEKEQADLTHFAERSAKRHGCGAPAARN